jgi:hypothetical protein
MHRTTECDELIAPRDLQRTSVSNVLNFVVRRGWSEETGIEPFPPRAYNIQL